MELMRSSGFPWCVLPEEHAPPPGIGFSGHDFAALGDRPYDETSVLEVFGGTCLVLLHEALKWHVQQPRAWNRSWVTGTTMTSPSLVCIHQADDDGMEVIAESVGQWRRGASLELRTGGVIIFDPAFPPIGESGPQAHAQLAPGHYDSFVLLPPTGAISAVVLESRTESNTGEHTR